MDFITLQLMELYPPLRGFIMEYNEQICVRDNKILADIYSKMTRYKFQWPNSILHTILHAGKCKHTIMCSR